MSELLTQLRRVTTDLDRSNIPYALVGGMALSLRVEPRFTRDMDLAVAASSDAEAEQLGRMMIDRGYSVAAQVEHETAGRLATLRLTLPGAGDVIADLLFASCGIEPEIVAAAERLEAVQDWFIPVAQSEHLLAMKILASDAKRPQDLVDAHALLATLTPQQIEHARNAIKLIESRGFHRRKNLAQEFERFLRDADVR